MIHRNKIHSINKYKLKIISTQIKKLIGIKFSKINKYLKKEIILIFMLLMFQIARNS
jgi:hypothetical protein